MKPIFLFLLLAFQIDFATATPNYPPSYFIPAGGETINDLDYFQVASQTFYVSTTGTVNLGGNTYTLTYATLPSANTTWNVIFDATNLTVTTATNVNLFGETPLATYSPLKKFFINFSVVWVAGRPTKVVKYFASLDDLKTFSMTANFNARVNFNDTVMMYSGKDYLRPTSAISAGAAVVAGDTAGKLAWGCTPWCETGNSGTIAGTNFIGTTDAQDLVFKSNSQEVGRLTTSSVFFGLESYSGFAGSNNTAIGKYALLDNASGINNTAVGGSSLFAVTTGTDNVGIGYITGANLTTGLNNVFVGSNAGGSLTTGDNNIVIGRGADVALTSTSKGVAIGYGAIADSKGIALGDGALSSPNQLTFAGVRSVYVPNASNSIRYVLTDTSGSGNFVPQPLTNYAATTFTPVTGDSISVSTSQNDINPAGTLAVLTVILPSSPYSGQILEFSTTQVLTSLLWSIRLSGGTTLGLPSALAQYGTVKIKWNSTLSKWINY